jgi:hypothetical protein
VDVRICEDSRGPRVSWEDLRTRREYRAPREQ